MFWSGFICVSQYLKSVLYYETLQKHSGLNFLFIYLFIFVRGFHIPWTILYCVLKTRIWIMTESRTGTDTDCSMVLDCISSSIFLLIKLTHKYFFVFPWAVSVNNWINGCSNNFSHRKSQKYCYCILHT